MLVVLVAAVMSVFAVTAGTAVANAAPNVGALQLKDGATAEQIGPDTYQVHDKDGQSRGVISASPIDKPGAVHTYVSVGFGNGFYIYLTPLEQKELVAGGAGALGALICAIPAVGQLSCALVVGALAAGVTYINEKGICPGRLEIRSGGFHLNQTSLKCIT